MNDCVRKMPFFQTLVREVLSLEKAGYRTVHIPTDDKAVAEGAKGLYEEICFPLRSGSDPAGSGSGNLTAETSERRGTKAGAGRASLGPRPADESALKGKSTSASAISVVHISELINKTGTNTSGRNAQGKEITLGKEGTLTIIYGHMPSDRSDLDLSGMGNYVATVELPPMDPEDITAIIREEVGVFRSEVFGGRTDAGESSFEVDDETIRWYCNRMKRLEYSEIRRIIRRFLRCGRCRNNFECLYETGLQEKFREKTQCAERYFIVPAKNEKLKRHNKLECIRITDQDDYTLCGAGAINKWFDDHEAALTNWENPLAPKGMFLVGVPGTGKSLTAKYAAKRLKLPLVKLDIGKVLGRYVGDSEHAMQEAMEDLTFNAPCILWIDEIEKSFGKESQDSSGVMSRLFGQLLNFMQEKKEKVFVIATANSTQNLPPELMRLGRFDIHFKMMMPTWEECRVLLKNSFRKAGKELKAASGAFAKTGLIDSVLSNEEDRREVLGIITGCLNRGRQGRTQEKGNQGEGSQKEGNQAGGSQKEGNQGTGGRKEETQGGSQEEGRQKGRRRFVTGADIDTIVREIVQLNQDEEANESIRLKQDPNYQKSNIFELTEKVMSYISVTAEEENPTSLEKLGESYLNLLPQAFVLANSEPDPQTGSVTKNPFRNASHDLTNSEMYPQTGPGSQNPFRDASHDLANSEMYPQTGPGSKNPFRDVSLDKSKVLDYFEGCGSDPTCLPLGPVTDETYELYDRELYRCVVREMNRILVRDPDCLDKKAAMKKMKEMEKEIEQKMN